MSRIRLLLAAIVASLSFCVLIPGAIRAQAATPSTVSNTMRPALSQVGQTLNSINVRRWKAPGPVRDEVGNDVSAIQRDLNGTLSGLLQQADAAPTSIPAAFAVYRNVDALYDTLLRVVETADLAAPDNEVSQLEATLKTLESARASLGDAILSGAQTEQAEVVHLRAAYASASAAAQQRNTKTTVIDDGPATTRTTHHRATSAKKPPAKPEKKDQSTTPQH